MKTFLSLVRSARKTPAAGGFSLVELLVAIAVVAILATILVPTVGSMRGRGLTTKDGIQLRGWGMEWLLLNQEGGRVRHWASGPRPAPDPAQYWTWYLINAAPTWAMGVERLKQGRSPMYEYNSTWSAGEFYGFVLSVNPGPGQLVTNPNNSSAKEYIMEFADVAAPSDLPWVANSFDGNKQAHTIRRGAAVANSGRYHLVHDGKANVMFFDGHLELAGPKRLHDLGATEVWSKDGTVVRTADYKDEKQGG